MRLLLSGGGFRATVFHLGVIRYLRETKRIKDVEEVYSISGGSVLAAHLLLNWDDYSGESEENFTRSASDLVDFVKGGVREQIIRKAVFGWLSMGLVALLPILYVSSYVPGLFVQVSLVVLHLVICFLVFTRIESYFRPVSLLESAYFKLFKERVNGDLRDGRPRAFILSSNLNTGNIACFTPTHLCVSVSKSSNAVNVPLRTIKLAKCVAASSAFPPVFSPVAVDPNEFKIDRALLSETQYLSDGGVIDNIGFRAMKLLSTSQSMVLVSDAERRFDLETASTYRWLPTRAARSIDILMNRVSSLESESAANPNMKFARLQDDFESTESSSLLPEMQSRARRIRTDLDAFSECEIQLLFVEGYTSAKVAFGHSPTMGDGVVIGDNGIPSSYDKSKGCWLPFNGKPALGYKDVQKRLDRTAETRAKLLTWNPLEWWHFAFPLLLLILLNPVSTRIAYTHWLRKTDIAIEKMYGQSGLSVDLSFLSALLPPEEPNDLYVIETSALPLELESRCVNLKPERHDDIKEVVAIQYFDELGAFRILELCKEDKNEQSFQLITSSGTSKLYFLVLLPNSPKGYTKDDFSLELH